MMYRQLLTLSLALSLSTACSRADPITDYTFIVQWMGDKSYEQGTTVCGVARAQRHVIALPHATDLTCRPQDYSGSTGVVPAFSDPPAWIEELPWDAGIAPPQAPITKLRAWGPWSVGLAPNFGLVVDHFPSEMSLERRFQLQLAQGAPLADLEVQGPWAFVADGVGELIVVSLADLPDPNAVARVDVGGPARDVYVDGAMAVVLAERSLVVVDLSEPMSPRARGRLAFTDPTVEGVGLRGDRAWVAAGGLLYTVDVSNPDAPALLDPAGVESTVAGITLIHGDYLFQAPGFNAPLAVTHLGDPDRPEPFWAFMGGNGVFDVAAIGHTLYLAVGSGGVHIWGPERDYADAFGQ